jgi:hypothetical protein
VPSTRRGPDGAGPSNWPRWRDGLRAVHPERTGRSRSLHFDPLACAIDHDAPFLGGLEEAG